jgi:nucleotide-binding universal stress UspA family protein
VYVAVKPFAFSAMHCMPIIYLGQSINLIVQLISRILVAVDGSENSERALKTAIKVASQLDAELIIANVLEDYGDAAKVWKKHDVVVKELEQEHDALLRKYRTIAVKELPNKVETVRAEGHAAEQILKIADRVRAGVIVVGSRGLSAAKGIFLGSVSHKLVQLSERPVLVVK